MPTRRRKIREEMATVVRLQVQNSEELINVTLTDDRETVKQERRLTNITTQPQRTDRPDAEQTEQSLQSQHTADR